MFTTTKIDAHARAVSVFEDYNDRFRLGGEEKDEALQNAIAWAFRNDADLNHLEQADLYAPLYEKLNAADTDPRMVLVIIEGAIRTWANI